MSPGAATTLVLLLLLAAAVVVTLAMVRHASRSRAAGLLDRGDFRGAMDAAAEGAGDRDARLAAAVGAKHLLELERAATLLGAVLDDDPGDGEAWLELGLVEAYRGRHDEAERAFAAAAARRADLVESLTLHRAWLALIRGDTRRARRLFEEVEAPIESKLRHDLGPGDPLFCEWFLQAGDLWRAAGDERRAEWSRRQGLESAPGSELAKRLAGDPGL